MGGYEFVVPKLVGSRWDKPGRRYSSAGDWPRVGIYCRSQHDVWLLGSFSVTDEVLEQRDEVYWGWDAQYLTGDGFLIRLDVQSGASAAQQLVGDQLRDRRREDHARRRAMELLETGEVEAASEWSARVDQEQSDLRLRIPMKCPECGYARVFRSDTVQTVVNTFWNFGIREIGVREFAARVDRRAR